MHVAYWLLDTFSMKKTYYNNIFTEDDKPCEEAGGNCQYAKGGCFGGCFSKGMCGGPDDRQCCIPTPKSRFFLSKSCLNC